MALTSFHCQLTIEIKFLPCLGRYWWVPERTSLPAKRRVCEHSWELPLWLQTWLQVHVHGALHWWVLGGLQARGDFKGLGKTSLPKLVFQEMISTSRSLFLKSFRVSHKHEGNSRPIPWMYKWELETWVGVCLSFYSTKCKRFYLALVTSRKGRPFDSLPFCIFWFSLWFSICFLAIYFPLVFLQIIHCSLLEFLLIR